MNEPPEFLDDYIPPDIPTAENDPELRKLEALRPVKPKHQSHRERVEQFQEDIYKSKSTSETELDRAADDILKNGLCIPSRFGLNVRLYPGTVNTLSGGSGHGKSTLALNFLAEWVSNPTENNLDGFFIYVSYENSPVLIRHKLRDIGLRLEKAGAQFPAPWSPSLVDNVYITSDIELENFQSLIEAARTIKAKNIYIGEPIILRDIPIILVIDYLQIVRTHDPKINRLTGYEGMKAVSLELEQLARDENIIILALCQQNSEGQIRESRDIFFYSSVSIDLYNHFEIPGVDPDELDEGERKKAARLDIWKQHKDKSCHGKSICSLVISKNRYGEKSSRIKSYYFDGYVFSDIDYERERDAKEDYLSKVFG